MSQQEIFAKALRSLFAPIVDFLDDASVSEIMINGPRQVFIERRGRLELTDAQFSSSAAIMAALRNVAQYAGTYVDDSNPILEAQLPDGSRLEAVLSPIVQDGPAVAIRRFARATMTLPRLIELGALDERVAEVLIKLVRAKRNILVAGGTGSGKTSLLNVLAAYAPEGERLIVLEDTREVQIGRGHVLYMEARKADEQGQGALPIRALFRASLRMRPDRIIVGEIRGAEAIDMVQAMVSGHGGCLSTLHASSPLDALGRLETMCMMSELTLPLSAVRSQIGSGIDVVVQVARVADGSRRITHVTEVERFDLQTGSYGLRDLFALDGHTANARLRATDALDDLESRLNEGHER